MKISLVTSTRADWGLLYPLVKELDSRGERPVIIATYAHLFPEMGDTIQELVADGFPPSMSVPARQRPDEAIADTVTGFTKAFRFLKPDLTVILGDRFEMMGVASAATLSQVPVAHIAGGTVSAGAFDDVFRNALSQMAEYHFPETDRARRRLTLMGADPAKVVTAGALGVYNALHVPPVSIDEIENYLEFDLGDKFLLGTFHPATREPLNKERGSENEERRFDPIEQMKTWIEGLDAALDADPDLKLLLTFPNSDTDPTPLLGLLYTFQAARRGKTARNGRVRVVPSLGRVKYLNAARYAAAVAGNSSSGIVEIPSLGTPVVNVGHRQEGRQCSKAVMHCPLEKDAVADAITMAMTTDSKLMAESTPNPYYKEDTPRIIADTLLAIGK